MHDKDAGSDDTYEHISYISLNGQENTSTKMHYGETRYEEHTTGIPPTMMHYLADASLKQSPAQGCAQSGGDDQEVMNQQRGPATQFMEEQGRSTRHMIRQSDHTHHGITTHDL